MYSRQSHSGVFLKVPFLSLGILMAANLQRNKVQRSQFKPILDMVFITLKLKMKVDFQVTENIFFIINHGGILLSPK
jgi:hypothetical protein